MHLASVIEAGSIRLDNSLYSLIADCQAFARFRLINLDGGSSWSIDKEEELRSRLTQVLGAKKFKVIESLSHLGPLLEDDVIAVIGSSIDLS